MSETDDLEEQPVRDDSTCPKCGGESLPDLVVHNLSAIGYKHDDQRHVCAECGHEWYHGVPIGEFDRPEMADDLRCSDCGDEWMLVHRVAPKSAHVVLHLKCPECFNFDRVERALDDANGNVALVGYPQITGSTEGCDPYGYQDDDAEECPEPLCIEHGNGTLGCPLDQ
jgi:DNA-directed RNA polymerase subunit RPC12/RpoP